MTINDFVKPQQLIRDVSVRVGDPEFNKGLTKGFYFGRLRQYLDEIAYQTYFDKKFVDIDLPANWQLMLDLPKNAFNINAIYGLQKGFTPVQNANTNPAKLCDYSYIFLPLTCDYSYDNRISLTTHNYAYDMTYGGTIASFAAFIILVGGPPFLLSIFKNGAPVVSSLLSTEADVDNFFASIGFTKTSFFNYHINNSADVWGRLAVPSLSNVNPVITNPQNVLINYFPYTITSKTINGTTTVLSQVINNQGDQDTFMTGLGLIKTSSFTYGLTASTTVYGNITLTAPPDSPAIHTLTPTQTACGNLGLNFPYDIAITKNGAQQTRTTITSQSDLDNYFAAMGFTKTTNPLTYSIFQTQDIYTDLYIYTSTPVVGESVILTGSFTSGSFASAAVGAFVYDVFTELATIVSSAANQLVVNDFRNNWASKFVVGQSVSGFNSGGFFFLISGVQFFSTIACIQTNCTVPPPIVIQETYPVIQSSTPIWWRDNVNNKPFGKGYTATRKEFLSDNFCDPIIYPWGGGSIDNFTSPDVLRIHTATVQNGTIMFSQNCTIFTTIRIEFNGTMGPIDEVPCIPRYLTRAGEDWTTLKIAETLMNRYSGQGFDKAYTAASDSLYNTRYGSWWEAKKRPQSMDKFARDTFMEILNHGNW